MFQIALLEQIELDNRSLNVNRSDYTGKMKIKVKKASFNKNFHKDETEKEEKREAKKYLEFESNRCLLNDKYETNLAEIPSLE